MDSPVWLITGCSYVAEFTLPCSPLSAEVRPCLVRSGFGIELARIALQAKHRVIATSRNPSKTPELVKEVEEAGGRWFTLDVADPAPHVTKDIVEQALKAFGRIDVLVNNAGTCLTGIVEFLTDAQVKDQFETNFHGPHRLIAAVLPVMRSQKSGTIGELRYRLVAFWSDKHTDPCYSVNISSIGGISAHPSLSMYAASKHALEGEAAFANGFTENLC